MSFFHLKWRPKRRANRAEILQSLRGILSATIGNFILAGSDQVTELWRHKRNSLGPIFNRNRISSPLTRCLWLEWRGRHYAWFWSGDNHIWPLTWHLDLSKVIRGLCPWTTPYLPKGVKLTVLGISWDSDMEYRAHFPHYQLLGPLYRFRCNLEPLTRFARGRFFRWGWRSLSGCYT